MAPLPRYEGPARKVLVIGGNGYIGSHVLRELLSRREREPGLRVASISRSGMPPKGHPAWARDVEWLKGDALQAQSDSSAGGSGSGSSDFERALQGASAVISTVGGFGSAETMRTVNGRANVAAMEAARAAGVPRFVYLSAHHYALPAFLQRGYFEGKLMAERALADKFGAQGVQIRPSFVYGTRQVGDWGLPLWLLGKPLQLLTNTAPARALAGLPLVGSVLAPLLLPPVSVHAVVRAAVDAALQVGEPALTVVDVDDILKYEE